MLKVILSWLVYSVLRLRYKVEISGFDELKLDKDRGVLFLPNHPAYVDPLLLVSILGRKFCPGILIDEDQLQRPLIKFIRKMIPLFPIPDIVKVRTKGVQAINHAVDQLVTEIDNGSELLLYPSGRIYRQDHELVHGTSSVHTILKNAKKKPQIVLVRTKGLWGSSLSFGATGKKPALGWRELFWFGSMVLLNLIFFVPKRKVSVEFTLDDSFPHDQTKQEMNHYLEKYYNEIPDDRLIVPYYFFKRRLILRKALQKRIVDQRPSLDIITSATRNTIEDYLKKEMGIDKLEDNMSLAIDLDMDSLAKAELILWIDQEFGVMDANTDQINTVADAFLYAQDELPLDDDDELGKEEGIHADWYGQGSWKERSCFRMADNILEAIVYQARKNPRRKMIAERNVGVKSYRDIIISVAVIKEFVKDLEGDKIGFMLPASTASVMAYLSIIASGKTPVMLNWTVGKRNLEHAIKSLGIKKIVTANLMLSKLKDQGIELDVDSNIFFPLEDLKKNVTLTQKIKAAFIGHFNMKALLKENISKTAAILFTSGSENLPKTVPLSHKNVLTNIEGVLDIIPLYGRDKFLGFLPPFHSFGLTAHVTMPLVLGVPVVYHNNPTQPNILAKIIEKYRPTVLIATPTFLNGILKRSKGLDLSSLRIAVVGAEKCPASVFKLAQETCQGVEIMEGYGITECSPVLAANPYGSSKLGTIGKILPNVEYLMTDPNNPSQIKTDHTTPSMLMVRGVSIFDGYINYEGESPFVTIEGKEYYKTGDLLLQDDEGYLTFAGRLKRFIKIGGEMVSLPAIETELLNHFKGEDGLAPIAIEARETDGRPEIVLFTTIAADRQEVNKLLKKAGFSGLSNIREVQEIEAIPLLGTGKIDYRTLKSRL